MSLNTGPILFLMFSISICRDKPKTYDDLGQCLISICQAVPGGVVCFLPSYDYESRVFAHFEKSGILERINEKKGIFREPRRAGLADQVSFFIFFFASVFLLCF